MLPESYPLSDDSAHPETSLYPENVEDFGDWPIILSARAQKDLQDANNVGGATFQITMNKIKQLSKGQFSRSNHKLLTAPEMKMRIYAARMAGDQRMIYQIDCISDPRNSYGGAVPYESQAIRIFGIFTLAELHRSRFWNTLGRQSERRSSDYVERCAFRNEPQAGAGENVILPAMFPSSPEQDEDIREFTPLTGEEDVKEMHSLLVLDKFVVLSQAVLNSIRSNKEVVHIPPLSAREWEIIEHPTSCYVIGRSGTGKTTTMLLKMLGIQRTWEQYPGMGSKPRQVFVTRSQVLVTKVEEYFAKLVSAFKHAADSPEEIHMTDKDMDQELSEQEDELIGQDYRGRWRPGLPERFSELLDEHFPLFITYDQLCTMVENDIHSNTGSSSFKRHALRDDTMSSINQTSPWKTRQLVGSQIASSSDYMQQSRENFISYKVFVSSYWDRFPQASIRRLDPALVFGEFMGVIKGSGDTVGMKDRCLDQGSYKLLSARGQANLSHKWDEIYDLFVAYNKLKGQRGDYDAADRTHCILEALQKSGFIGQGVDFLYVDEVQDYLLIDTLFLRKICTNQHGLFWAGDTAQTISIGSSFRFADLKAYQHHIEKQLSCKPGLTPVEPRTFELVSNHRSHSGIVNCARSIVNLIIHYWPHSIDALKPEQATTPGFRPIFFAHQDDTELVQAFFTNGQEENIDLGAKQCILVHNDATKARLGERFPRLGCSNFMTLHESKGLEFNDVMLYNFFEDSPATANQWRLILNKVSDGNNTQGAPTFDELRHASICTELKFLYVAITRARQNLWIADSSESAEPMKRYWSSMDQISIWPATTKIPMSAVKSTPEGWLKEAKMMFHYGHYAQASVAFKRAAQDRKAGICDAYALQEKAALTSTTTSAIRIQAFLTSAKAFLDCAQNTPPRHVKERLTCYEAAGDCYKEAHDLRRAADNYWLAEKYNEAAITYQEIGHIDEMVEVITQHRDTFDGNLHEQLMTFAQMHYFKSLNTKAALKLFPSVDKALEFLKDLELDEAHTKLLTELGQVLEAAAIYAKKGDLVKAVEMLSTSATHHVDHTQQMFQYLLTGLRRGFTLGITITQTTSSTLSKLLVLADQLHKSTEMKQGFDELAMFQAIGINDHATLRVLAKTFVGAGNDLLALLCLDHAFSSPLKLQNLQLFEVQASLSLYLDYVRLLDRFLRDESVSNGSNNQRLFGFQVLGSGCWLVPKSTLLHGKLSSRLGSGDQSADGYRCRFDELRRVITETINSRIHDRTKSQNSACCEVQGFSPCLEQLVQDKCCPPYGRRPCTFQHIQPTQLTVDWYHAQLRLILLQFNILDTAGYCKSDVVNYWLRILYSTLHPPLQMLGSLANLDVSRIPEGDAGFRIVQRWVRDACIDPDNVSSKSVDRSRQCLMVASTLAFDLDRENTPSFVRTAPMEILISEDDISLTLGSSYLREFMDRELRADVCVLCNLAEMLSGLFIVAHKFDSHGGMLHDVTLPRSWFINLVLPRRNLGKDSSTLPTFVIDVIDLMQQIDEQVQQHPTFAFGGSIGRQFIADGNRMTNLTGSLCIARICLCLCLIGYNIQDDDLREEILAGIQSLRTEDGQPIPWGYQRYADAECWDDLAHAFTKSLKNSPFDEFIRLLRANTFGTPRQPSKHIRTVSYDRLDEVPKLLSMAPSPFRDDAISTHATRPHVGKGTGVQPNSDHSKQEQKKNAETDERQINAARIIQASYRRCLKRKNVVRKGIDETQAHFWHLLRKRSTEMEWSKGSQYYLLFRVPLADILVCLDVIGAFFESKKRDASKRMKEAHNKEFEELMEARSEYSKFLRQTITLLKKLSPSSNFHLKRSVSDLQDAVLEVKAIAENLDSIPGSIKTKNRIKRQWDRGSKWIFERQESRGKGKNAERSKLVPDREDLLWL